MCGWEAGQKGTMAYRDRLHDSGHISAEVFLLGAIMNSGIGGFAVERSLAKRDDALELEPSPRAGLLCVY
jgi:hypothetical protein